MKRLKKEEGTEREEEKGAEEIEFEEIEMVMRRLKKGKTAGEDGIQNEVWI